MSMMKIKIIKVISCIFIILECLIIAFACLTRIWPELLSQFIMAVNSALGFIDGSSAIINLRAVILICCPICIRYMYQHSKKTKHDKIYLLLFVIIGIVAMIALTDINREFLRTFMTSINQ